MAALTQVDAGVMRKILNTAQARAHEKIVATLKARMAVWRLELSDEQVNTLAGFCALTAREEAGNVFFAAHHAGIVAERARLGIRMTPNGTPIPDDNE